MKSLRRKLILSISLLAVLLIPVQSVLAVSYSSQVSGKAPDHPTDWVIKIWYLKTTIWPSTGHIEGEVRFTIQVPRIQIGYVEVAEFYIFGDAPDDDHETDTESYTRHQYYVEWDESPETHTEYIDIYVDETSASAYSTTLRLLVFSNAFDVGRKYIYEQVYWVKVGSVYWAFSSGFCCTYQKPADVYLT